MLTVGTWTILERWLDHLNASLIQDNDDNTCITPNHQTQTLTLANNSTYRGYFETEVVLSTDIDHLISNIIRVFTTTDLSSPSATCQLSGPLWKCRQIAGSKFACICDNYCHVYVKLFWPDDKMVPLRLCEIWAK